MAATPRGAFWAGHLYRPQRELVIVTNANWAGGARDPAAMKAREQFYREVQQAVDAEQQRSKD